MSAFDRTLKLHLVSYFILTHVREGNGEEIGTENDRGREKGGNGRIYGEGDDRVQKRKVRTKKKEWGASKV